MPLDFVRYKPEMETLAPDLDQLMGLQRPVDLGEDFVGEAVLVADDDDRGEPVRLRAQLAAP